MSQKSILFNQYLKSGESCSDSDVQRLGLSPSPVLTGRKPGFVSHFLNKNSDGLLEFKLVNPDVISLQIIFFLIFFMTMIIITMWVKFGHALVVLPLLIPFTLIFFFLSYFNFKDQISEVKTRPAVVFNAQRKELLLSWVNANKPKPQRPNVMKSDFSIFMAVLGSLGIVISSAMTIDFIQGDMNDFEEASYYIFGSFFVGAYPMYYTIRPWISYLKNRSDYKSTVEVFPVSWESINIEYQSYSGLNPFGQVGMQNLTFIAPIPDHPDHEKALVSLPVYSKEEAFSLFELLCDYMENGANGIEHTAAKDVGNNCSRYNRQGYKRLILKRMRKTPLIYPFWRVLNWITLRYFAHWYLEYQVEVAQQLALNRRDIQEWSKPIPEDEWVSLSDELNKANKKVRDLYSKGLIWESPEVQRIIKQLS